jgi:hypothetical protein
MSDSAVCLIQMKPQTPESSPNQKLKCTFTNKLTIVCEEGDLCIGERGGHWESGIIQTAISSLPLMKLEQIMHTFILHVPTKPPAHMGALLSQIDRVPIVHFERGKTWQMRCRRFTECLLMIIYSEPHGVTTGDSWAHTLEPYELSRMNALKRIAIRCFGSGLFTRLSSS